MKKLVLLLVIAALLVSIPVFAGGSRESGNAVTLTMGSWRADDVAQMNALFKEYNKIKPNVKIDFKPTNPPDYNATLRLQLQNGTGPDLILARSYATGQQLYADGYFADCSDLKGLQENFTAGNRAPWTTKDGKAFGIPFIAVVQPVYYNRDLFAKAGVSVPNTWEELLVVCDKLQKAGITPIANGLGEEWDINECFMMAILPGFVGGYDGRLAYETNKVPLNDPKMVAAFQAMADIAKYCPRGFEALNYNDSNALFATGQAAMYFDGSWTVGMFDDVPFNMGVFAPPAPAGNKPAVCFHPDAGLTYNKATKYPKECREFLEWLCSPEGAAVAAKNLPAGMYPLINAKMDIPHRNSNDILALTQGRLQDARFVWARYMDGDPSGYTLMNEGVIAVMKGQKTAKQAADDFAAGVAKWYKP